jgi:anaerobic selenocysteine-containing dehydrogenase
VTRGTFLASTRRGKQFNSMVQRDRDPLTGADRDAILISGDDLERLGARDGQMATLRSERGTFVGRLRRAPIKPGNLEVHWPEGNALLTGDLVDPDSLEPDYNAVVTVAIDARQRA